MTYIDNPTVRFNADYLSPDSKLVTAGSTKLLSFKQTDYRDDLYFDTETNGTGIAVYEQTNGGVKMSVSANLDFVIRQSKIHANYISGNPQQIEMTTINLIPVTNVVKRLGYYTSNTTTPFNSNLDGCYLETDNTTVYAKVSKDGTDLCNIAQASWNLDTMDGTGPSGITLDLTKFEILVMDFLYLGGTSVRFGTIINGNKIWFHRYDHSNSSDTTVFLSPNKPLRWEIRSTGGTSHLYHICGAVESQGTVGKLGTILDYSNGTTAVTCATTGIYYALKGIELTYRNATVIIDSFGGFAKTADKFHIILVLNPTVASTFTYTQVTGQPYAVATGVSANTVTGGTIIGTNYGESGAGLQNVPGTNQLRLGTTIIGVGDKLVLCASPIGNTADIFGALSINSLI